MKDGVSVVTDAYGKLQSICRLPYYWHHHRALAPHYPKLGPAQQDSPQNTALALRIDVKQNLSDRCHSNAPRDRFINYPTSSTLLAYNITSTMAELVCLIDSMFGDSRLMFSRSSVCVAHFHCFGHSQDIVLGLQCDNFHAMLDYASIVLNRYEHAQIAALPSSAFL